MEYEKHDRIVDDERESNETRITWRDAVPTPQNDDRKGDPVSDDGGKSEPESDAKVQDA